MGEFELIERMQARLQAAGLGAGGSLVVGSGDDAAVIAARQASVVSVDAVVEGVHFRRPQASLRSVGHKGLAAALSDLAAMGAAPGEAYAVLGVPRDLGEADCLELLDGLLAGARRWRVRLAGGDVTRSPCLFVSLTVVGDLAATADAIRRDGARSGDVVVVTGELGGAGAGLLLLERPRLASELPGAQAEELRRRQLEPEPRLAAGLALARAGASAMIDLSDGLAGDACHVARASDVGLEIALELLPLQAGVAESARHAGIDPLELAVSGGEDYELLACLPPDLVAPAREAVGSTGTELTVIGEVAEAGGAPGARLRDATGRLWKAPGFDQLRPGVDEPSA